MSCLGTQAAITKSFQSELHAATCLKPVSEKSNEVKKLQLSKA